MEHGSSHKFYMRVTGLDYMGMDSQKETDFPFETSAAGRLFCIDWLGVY